MYLVYPKNIYMYKDGMGRVGFLSYGDWGSQGRGGDDKLGRPFRSNFF